MDLQDRAPGHEQFNSQVHCKVSLKAPAIEFLEKFGLNHDRGLLSILWLGSYDSAQRNSVEVLQAGIPLTHSLTPQSRSFFCFFWFVRVISPVSYQ
jgi:hypothetical protein